MLYDLTNTFFEGSKTNSRLAKYGQSNEKRPDAKLVVLALVVNMEGFTKYSAIYEGNTRKGYQYVVVSRKKSMKP